MSNLMLNRNIQSLILRIQVVITILLLYCPHASAFCRMYYADYARWKMCFCTAQPPTPHQKRDYTMTCEISELPVCFDSVAVNRLSPTLVRKP